MRWLVSIRSREIKMEIAKNDVQHGEKKDAETLSFKQILKPQMHESGVIIIFPSNQIRIMFRLCA